MNGNSLGFSHEEFFNKPRFISMLRWPLEGVTEDSIYIPTLPFSRKQLILRNDVNRNSLTNPNYNRRSVERNRSNCSICYPENAPFNSFLTFSGVFLTSINRVNWTYLAQMDTNSLKLVKAVRKENVNRLHLSLSLLLLPIYHEIKWHIRWHSWKKKNMRETYDENRKRSLMSNAIF